MKHPVRFLGFALAGFDQIIPIISLIAWFLQKILDGWRQYKDNPPIKE